MNNWEGERRKQGSFKAENAIWVSFMGHMRDLGLFYGSYEGFGSLLWVI